MSPLSANCSWFKKLVKSCGSPGSTPTADAEEVLGAKSQPTQAELVEAVHSYKMGDWFQFGKHTIPAFVEQYPDFNETILVRT